MANPDKHSVEQFQDTEATTTSPKKHRKRTMFGFTLLALAIIAGAWYFLYFTKTPEYSLNNIRKAVVKHDVSLFKKHVDLDNLLAHGYDDVLSVLISTDQKLANDSRSRVLVESLAQILKGMLVAEGKYSVLRYVETGKWDQQNNNKQTPSKSPTPSVKEITKDTGLNDAEFKGVAYIKTDANTTNIGTKFLLKGSSQEVVLDVKMRKLPDGSWQVAEITNLKEFLLEAYKAKKVQK